jgi:two-component system, sensor histidine kinase and response regulator
MGPRSNSRHVRPLSLSSNAQPAPLTRRVFIMSHSPLTTEVPPAAHRPVPHSRHSLTPRDQLCREELDVLCYALSHDLRPPLRSIEGFSQVILESVCEKVDDQTAACFQRVIKASQEVGSLLDGLLQLTRVTRHVLSKVVVDLSDLAQRVVTKIRSLDPDRTARVTIMPELSAFGDPLLLRLALEQLFENAWKFTRLQRSPAISFGGNHSGSESVFYLFDNGIGFNMACYHKLFRVFERLHVLPDFAGSGLGLAIVKRILQRHHGTIWANGVPGVGACFSFTIPNHRTHETTTLHSHGRRQR